jgi:hypothetical protein
MVGKIMKYSKSMYRAGWIVNAEECDYESSRKLGLVCPFCSEALFWASGYKREVRQRPQIVAPAFRHYKSADPLAQDCELRAARPDGVEYIQQLQIQSRNQRLDLFNRRLWEIFCESMPGLNSDVKTAKKLFGAGWIEQQAKLGRLYFNQHQAEIYEEIALTFRAIKNSELTPAQIFAAEIAFSFPERVADIARIQGFDTKIHLAVCQEVVDFLGTRTAGYAFQKIFAVGVLELAKNAAVLKFNQPATHDSIFAIVPNVKAIKSIGSHAGGVSSLILNCNWIEVLAKLSGEADEN